jgi:phage shock protein PspC (stress-responsive transcriptional regulator)
MTDDRPPPPAEDPRIPPAAGPAQTPPTPPAAGPAQTPPTPPDAEPTDNPTVPLDAPSPTYDPPPLTAFAWRNGLVRPTRGRLLAGVCGALGRATNTDPILWRVVLAVLTLFGGIGVLAYLLGWLMLPAEGDTASPVEALAGQGASGTSRVLAIIGMIILFLGVVTYISDPFGPGLLAAAILGGAVLLLLRDQRGRARTAAGPVTAPAMWSSSGGVGVTTTPETPGTAPTPPAPAPAQPYAPQPPYAPAPPFAPRGPFAAGPLPPQPPTPPPYVPPAAKPPPPPKPPKPPRSRLGGLTVSVALIVLGALAILDVLGYDVPAAGYIAAALATVGAGLLVGAWLGRSRGLIALGIVLSVALASVAATHRVRSTWDGTTTWAPTTIDHVQDTYRQDVGNLRIDFSRVDFRSSTVNVDARVDLGNIEIVLPPNVDAVVDANVDAGKAEVLGQTWSGLGLDRRTVTDNGADGPDDGQLRINAVVDVGNINVHR